jgi:hypothetical protein
MTTLRLEFSNDAILEKVMEALRQFEKDGLSVIGESDYFTKTRKQVEKDLEEATKPEAKSYSEAELDEILEEVITKHEDQIR